MTDHKRGEAPGSDAPRRRQIFSAALAEHQRGRLAEADALYRQLLSIDPRHAEGLHYAGVVALQQGRIADAVALIGQSVVSDEGRAEAHYHLGLAFAMARNFEQAAAENRRAIALVPNYADAHMNLGNSLKELGQGGEAASCYERVIALNPSRADAHYNLANILADRRDFAAAIVSYERALSAQPNYPQARQNFGVALLAQLRIDEAIAQFDVALQLAPNFTEALLGLAMALLAKGAAQEALAVASRALDIAPTAEAKAMFARCAAALDRPVMLPGVEERLAAAIAEPWGRTSSLASFAGAMLLANGATAGTDLEALARNRLLRAVLEATPIVDLRLERALTAARAALLEFAERSETPAAQALTHLAAALARQCFINEYAFDLPDEESGRARKLLQRVLTNLSDGISPQPLELCVLAAYYPLDSLNGGERLLAQPWPVAVEELLTQQLREPAAERELRAAMPRLTPIDDDVSLKVREQYEQNPYPRWVGLPRLRQPLPLDEFLRKQYPDAPLTPVGRTHCEILVAGCGTGQQPLDYAILIADAQILAVDLSLSSLAHAKRKADEFKIRNVDFAQADILKLTALGRTFDMVTASGVLHHMREPFAAWRDLLKLVRPGGVMSLGFYSEMARQDVVAAREFAVIGGFPSTAEGIRRARRAIAALPDGNPVKNIVALTDFFSTSECRDLIFHVQEQRVTIPQIRQFIDENDVRFLGFDVGPGIAAQYLARFPHDPARTDLNNWHQFEMEHPRSFIGMYQFLIQRPPADTATPQE